MKKITVAGAGVGGLATAYVLSQNGFSVCVYEKNSESEMGYDWADCIEKNIFERVGLKYPGAKELPTLKRVCYFSPSKNVRLDEPERDKSGLGCIERKDLARFLIAECRKSGVEFYFETEIIGANCENNFVTGIKIKSSGEEKIVKSDLVIDACGMNSSVRRSLPNEYGIEKDISDDDIFFVYRGYHKRGEYKEYNPPYRMYFFHNKVRGLDWVISENDYYDVLIGAFGKLNNEEIESNKADFIAEYPDMSNEPFRGGTVSKIPVRPALPVFVCNGYAAIGDSAFMTEPLSGSGIGLNFRAASVLAKTVIENKDKPFDAKTLWKYNREYLSEFGFNQFMPYNIRKMLCVLTSEELNCLFDNRVLTEAEIIGPAAKYSLAELLKKGGIVLKKKNVIKAMAGFALKNKKIEKIKSALPSEYNENDIKAWTNLYKKTI